MPQTVIRGTQILNNTVQRQDLDTSTVGQAVVTKIIQGSGIALSSTGADSGTGDVTVSATVGAQGPPGENAFTTVAANFTVPAIGSTVQVTMADASFIIVGQMLWVDTAGGGTGVPAVMQVTAIAGNLVTLLSVI